MWSAMAGTCAGRCTITCLDFGRRSGSGALSWLRGTPVEAKATLHAYNPNSLQAQKVSPRINSTSPDDPELIQPIAG